MHVDEAVGNELVCDIKPGIRGDTNLLLLVGGFIVDGDTMIVKTSQHGSTVASEGKEWAAMSCAFCDKTDSDDVFCA